MSKFFNFDLSNFTNEIYTELLYVIGNKIYKKKIMDKNYKFFLSFKNATKAKKFISKLMEQNNLLRFGKFRNVFISIRPIWKEKKLSYKNGEHISEFAKKSTWLQRYLLRKWWKQNKALLEKSITIMATSPSFHARNFFYNLYCKENNHAPTQR